MNAFDELLGRPVSMRAFAVVRVLLGPIVVLHLRPFLADAADGRIYRDSFYEPYASWYPELPRHLYVALLWVGVVAAVALSLGLLTRLAAMVAFAVVTYNVFLSTTHFHNNRAYLVVVLAALAVTPCGRELSIDRWWRRRRGRPALSTDAPAWPLWLLRFEVSIVYGASGFSKLFDADWFGGRVTWIRVVNVRDRIAAESPLPGWAIDVLSDRSFHTVAAKVIVATEIFIAVGLWLRRTRYAAVFLALLFHLFIEVSASVQIFSLLAVVALAIWAVPTTRDRELIFDPADRRQRHFARLVGALDWLARFRIGAVPGARLRVVDRDGTTHEGGPALALALSRLPATAWFGLPARAFTRRRA